MPPKNSVTRTPAKGKPAQIVPTRAPAPGRLDLRDAVVRVVVPRADELSERQRAVGIEYGVDLERLAVLAAQSEQGRRYARRAGESDEAHALRDRHFVALAFARSLVLELEALRPTAEGAEGATASDAIDLRRAVEAAEAARARWTAPPRPADGPSGRDDGAPRRIAAAKAALEHGVRWAAQNRERPMRDEDGSGVYFGVPEVDPDLIRAEAAREAPELAAIPRTDWERALAEYPAARRGRGGDHRTRPTPWHVVVFSLLQPHALTKASNAKAMLSTYESAAKKRRRPSRAKR